ncbi:hypothetical protein MATL_G00179060 [Megalops atlanticus]|uniref:Uncharacterized protein n=1 Tax=Megalops atlanticus TaxID=7932 RepID=A0A9D3PLX8_MEGAT|nr:hypothetical protein MATL_G00179060 [Megalops atlanticus]
MAVPPVVTRAGLSLPACRYVARKVRAAVGGEEQPEKPLKAACGSAKARKGGGAWGERQTPGSGFEPVPKGGAPDTQVEQCRS